jgi:hypothetical protein
MSFSPQLNNLYASYISTEIHVRKCALHGIWIASYANIPMSMYMIRCSQQPVQVSNPSTYNQTMHNLVARAPNVESVRVPFLGDLVQLSSCTRGKTSLATTKMLTLIAYRAPPVRLNAVINAIQSRLILHICVSQPNSVIPWIMGIINDSPRPAYMAARYGRYLGRRNAGCRVAYTQPTARTDTSV